MTRHAMDLMSCEHVVQLLWDYLDEELDEARRARVREHLDMCVHCREHFTFEAAFLRALASQLDAPEDTTTLRSRVLDSLRAEGYGGRV